MLESYVAIDLEMTGLQPKTERILEIGAVKVIGHKQVETFQTFVNPHRTLSQTVSDLTGITQEMVADGLEDVEALEKFLVFVGDLTLVGHNIIFDYSFLKQCATNHKIPLEKMAVDTLKIARICLPDLESKRLEALCRHYHIAEQQEHRALADALMNAALFEILQDQFGDSHGDLFEPKPLQYKAKRQGPATPAQKRDLMELISYHKIIPDVDVEALTKSEASRMIDKILFAYGKAGR